VDTSLVRPKPGSVVIRIDELERHLQHTAVLSILDIALNTITVYCALVRCAVGATSYAYVEWNKKLSYVPQTDRATRCVS